MKNTKTDRAKALGHRLKLLRIWRKMNQKELAEKLGFSQTRLSDLEIGKKNIPMQTLLDIVEILEVDLNYFDLRKSPDLPE